MKFLIALLTVMTTQMASASLVCRVLNPCESGVLGCVDNDIYLSSNQLKLKDSIRPLYFVEKNKNQITQDEEANGAYKINLIRKNQYQFEGYIQLNLEDEKVVYELNCYDNSIGHEM